MEKVIILRGDDVFCSVLIAPGDDIAMIGLIEMSHDHDFACCSPLHPGNSFEGDYIISNNAIVELKRIELMTIKPLRDNFDLISTREPKPVYKERYAKRYHQKNSW